MTESIYHLLKENSCVTYLGSRRRNKICRPDERGKRGRLRQKIVNPEA